MTEFHSSILSSRLALGGQHTWFAVVASTVGSESGGEPGPEPGDGRETVGAGLTKMTAAVGSCRVRA